MASFSAKVVLALTALIYASGTDASRALCANINGTSLGPTHCLKYYSTPRTYAEAIAMCENEGIPGSTGSMAYEIVSSEMAQLIPPNAERWKRKWPYNSNICKTNKGGAFCNEKHIFVCQYNYIRTLERYCGHKFAKWSVHSGRCVKYFATEKTFMESQQTCQNLILGSSYGFVSSVGVFPNLAILANLVPYGERWLYPNLWVGLKNGDQCYQTVGARGGYVPCTNKRRFICEIKEASLPDFCSNIHGNWSKTRQTCLKHYPIEKTWQEGQDFCQDEAPPGYAGNLFSFSNLKVLANLIPDSEHWLHPNLWIGPKLNGACLEAQGLELSIVPCTYKRRFVCEFTNAPCKFISRLDNLAAFSVASNPCASDGTCSIAHGHGASVSPNQCDDTTSLAITDAAKKLHCQTSKCHQQYGIVLHKWNLDSFQFAQHR